MPRISEIYRPKSLKYALKLRAENPNAKPILGGTDLFVQLRGRREDTQLLDLSLLRELRGIKRIGETLWIGASATHHDISVSKLVIKFAPLIAKSSAILGSPAIRNRGTIGGNVANASPVADSIPTLIAHGANVHLVSLRGKREIQIEEFHLAPGKTVIEKDEIILGFSLPIIGNGFFGFYERLGSRAAVSIAKVGVALASRRSGNILSDVRIALSAVAPKVIRAPKAEEFISGKPLTKELIEKASEILATECAPITDHRSTCEYRGDMVASLFKIGMESAL